MAILKNLGKGASGKGVNSKISLILAHPELKIAKSITFWAVVQFDNEVEVKDELVVKLLQNLEVKQSEKGEFLVWNGKL